MNRQSILHLADLHLGAPPPEILRQVNPQLAQQVKSSRDTLLDRIADWVCSPDCPVGLVLIAGDLFDHHASEPQVVGNAMQALTRMVTCGIPVVTTAGNHDEMSYPNVVYKRQKWPGILVESWEPAEVLTLAAGELFDQALRVVSACFQIGKNFPGQVLEAPPVSGDALNVFLAHGTVEDPNFLPTKIVESERCFRIRLKQWSQQGYHYAALGHIHQPWVKSIEGMLACYPGSPVGKSAFDRGTGSLALVSTASRIPQHPGRPAVTVNFVEPPGVIGYQWKLVRENITAGERPEEIVERVSRKVFPTGIPFSDQEIVVVELTGTVSSQSFVQDCQLLFSQKGRPVLVVEGDIQPVPPVDIELLSREQSLLGEWVREWQRWRQEGRLDDNLAQMVLWEAISCFRREAER